MPRWEPTVDPEQQVRQNLKYISEQMGSDMPPPLMMQHSLFNGKQFRSTDPDFFASSGQSATTCSAQSPSFIEETKDGHAIILASRVHVTPARFVPMIRNPGKIAKPPKKSMKKEVVSKVQARRSQRQPAHKKPS